MSKQIVIAEQHRVAAVFSEDRIEEVIVAAGAHQVGDIFMGVVENILPSIDAAFVNIGDKERNGFIHVTDLGPLRLRRSANTIAEALAPQQKVLVQIVKEPTGNKGPRLTGEISLPGRYVVLLPFGRGVNLSRRIESEAERSRLRALAILIKPAGMGLLVRTEAEGVAEAAIVKDLETLQQQWESIQLEASSMRGPALLSRDLDFAQKVLRDTYGADVNRIVTDTAEGTRRVKQFLLTWGGGKVPPGLIVDHHREKLPLLEYFRVNAAIRAALEPRVDLPSGGYIVIEPTEALTVIDVNSGSFTKSQTSRETVLWTNYEAAVEVARQIRLRNIAGVIVVDFIDMDSRADRLQLLEKFDRALQGDKARPQIAQLTELGLVELTRKRQGQSLYELFGHTCPTCKGLGVLPRLPGEDVPTVENTSPRPLSAEWDIDVLEGEPAPLVGGTEPNLPFHPNYPEQRNGNRRDRRRGRDRVRRPEPKPEVREGRETAEVVRYSEADIEELPLEPEGTGLPEELEPEPERVEKAERRRESARRNEPPEVVVVEMTEEEQEVYAHMGISPLYMVGRDPKDVRNAVISIVLPGMAPTPIEALALATAPSEGEEEMDEAPEAAAEIESEPEPEAPAPEVPEPEAIAPPEVLESPVASRRRRGGRN
ncbi:MAG: Rne/Rng family ribonuclease [Pseudanabaenaceae cyanobacterium]